MTETSSAEIISETEIFELMSKLYGSPNRINFLRLLSSEPKSISEIKESLDVSPSTFSRLRNGGMGFDGFRSWGWIEESNDLCQLTRAGELGLKKAERSAKEVKQIQELCEFLGGLPNSEELAVNAEYLLDSDFEFRKTKRESPNLLVEVGREIERGSRIQGMSPFEDYWLVKELSQRVTDGMEAELVFSPKTAVQLENKYPGMWGEILEAETSKIKVSHDREIPFPLAIIDGTVIIGAQTEEKGLHAVLINESFEILQWATEKLSSQWEVADDYTD